MSFLKTIFVTTVLILSLMAPNYAKTAEDCVLTEEIACYYCDSHHNDHCGNPFKYSHYYVSTEIYLAACYGCCIKIVHPSENGERRIIRSCIENHPHLNITLNDECDSSDNTKRQVCLCNENLCNAANQNTNLQYLSTLLTASLLIFPPRLL